MKVLVITGDASFKSGHPRYELQRSAVDELTVVYVGTGAWWPTVPKGHVDVVTTQDPFWRGLFGWWAAKRVGAKLNVQVHADLSAHSLARRILARLVLRHADSIRVVSEKIKNQINTNATISVLPVYIDIERFRNVERKPEPGLVLWVGRLELEKDPLFALEVLKRVPNATLTMLGKGSLEPKVRAAAARLNLAARVDLPGWRDPLPYLARASVVLSTSLHESWGASIVEALAAGVPVVAPDVGIAREAGAIVVERSALADAVAEVLRTSVKGELKLVLPTALQWAVRWKESLGGV